VSSVLPSACKSFNAAIEVLDAYEGEFECVLDLTGVILGFGDKTALEGRPNTLCITPVVVPNRETRDDLEDRGG
jgi:hypothetical protein